MFVVIHLETRQLVRAASTMAPTAAWTVEQMRDLTAFRSSTPKFPLRDRLCTDCAGKVRIVELPEHLFFPKLGLAKAHVGTGGVDRRRVDVMSVLRAVGR